jgi:hypothetical protein
MNSIDLSIHKKLYNKVFISMAKQQSTDFVMFGEKKLSDLFGEIYSNQHSKKQKISDLIEEFKKQIRHAGDIASIGPVIKDLVKFSVENDDILIRLATIGQRFVAMEYKGTNDGGLLSDKEKEELLGELEKISKDVQAKTMDKVDDIEYELEEIQRKLEETKK